MWGLDAKGFDVPRRLNFGTLTRNSQTPWCTSRTSKAGKRLIVQTALHGIRQNDEPANCHHPRRRWRPWQGHSHFTKRLQSANSPGHRAV